MRLRHSPLTATVLAAVATLILAACTTGVDGNATTDSSAAAAHTQTIPTIVVLDGSESMTTADAPGPRIDAARDAVRALADGLPGGTDLGIVTFGSTRSAKRTPRAQGCTDVVTTVPLGPIHAKSLSNSLDGVVAQGFTPIGAALETAARELPETGPASIVLVSDGESTCAPDPCETAKSIHSAHPDVTVSAIGFRTDAASLQCIAETGGGLFVTADNAAQLAARLAAARDADGSANRLTPTSRGDIAIGDSLEDVRAAHPTFPSQGRPSGDRTVYVSEDCTYVVENGTVVEIAPGDPPGSTGVTIDGVTAGSAGSRAVELYGDALQDDDGVAIFLADDKAETAYKLGYEGGSSIEDGTVTTVILCGCLPEPEPDGPEVVTVTAVGRDGEPRDGWTIDTSATGLRLDGDSMQYCTPGLGATTPGVFACGTTADSAVVCWDDDARSQLLCAYSPFDKKLRAFSYSTAPAQKPVDADVLPWAIELADGSECIKRFGGAWSPMPDGYSPVYGCGGTPTMAIATKTTGDVTPEVLFDKTGSVWTVLVGGTAESGITPKPVAVKRIYYSAAEQ